MTSATDNRPLFARLVEYFGERFNLLNVLAAAVFSSGTGLAYVHATTSGRPPVSGLVAAALVVTGIFFIMRVSDEFKDAEDDARYRPERAVPRGLIRLSELRNLAGTVAAAQAILLLLVAPGVLPLLILTWGWVLLMTVEFGVGHRLKQHPVIYLVSHMLVMPLIALLAMAIVSRSLAGLASPVAVALAVLAFLAGLVMEIGRKIWSPEEERDGVDTYSRLWGSVPALLVWHVTQHVYLLSLVGFAVWLWIPGAVVAFVVLLTAVDAMIVVFLRGTNVRHSKLIGSLSAAIVLGSQLILGAFSWLA